MKKKSLPNLVGKVLYSTDWGRMIRTSFALVVRQTPTRVYLKMLPQIETGKNPQMWLAGTTVPDLTKINQYLDIPTKELTRAKVDWKEDGSFDYAYCKGQSFKLWDGEPKGFDYMD